MSNPKPWYLRRVVWVPVMVVAVSALIGLLAPSHATPTRAASSAPTPTTATMPTTVAAAPSTTRRPVLAPTATRTHAPAPAAPVDTLTGYGATVAAWDAHHTPDTAYPPGLVFDPDPSLPRDGGREGARYVAVAPIGGRITDYTVNFPATGNATAVERALLAEFAPDAYVLWDQDMPGCVMAEVVSATVHRVLHHTSVGDAQVVIRHELGTPGTGWNEADFADFSGASPTPGVGC